MNKLIFVAGVAGLALSGCSLGTQLTGDLAADAASAAALATATGDTSVIQCYTDIAAIGAAVQEANASSAAGAVMTLGPVTVNAGGGLPNPKLLTKLETSRAIQGLVADPNCASLELSLVNFALKTAIPGLGGVLP